MAVDSNGKEGGTPDDESRMQVEDKLEMDTEERTEPSQASSTNTRRRIVTKSEPIAVTTQEAVDGCREKAMRIASVEQTELGNIMDLSITGQVFRWQGNRTSLEECRFAERMDGT